MIYVADPDHTLERACRVAERLYKLSPAEWITVAAASVLMQRPVQEVMRMLRGPELFGAIADNSEVVVHAANVMKYMQEDIHERLLSAEQYLVDQVFTEELKETEVEASLVSSGAPLPQLHDSPKAN